MTARAQFHNSALAAGKRPPVWIRAENLSLLRIVQARRSSVAAFFVCSAPTAAAANRKAIRAGLDSRESSRRFGVRSIVASRAEFLLRVWALPPPAEAARKFLINKP
jgi:hypothetical protein